VELFGAQKFASVNGVLYMARGMASMVGTPVGGILAARRVGPGKYAGMAVLVSGLLFAATAVTTWVRVEAAIRRDGTFNWKWKM
jgi:hypothetical protein